MSKYLTLTKYLSKIQDYEVSLSFEEIEKILGFPLPESARKWRAWWSNDVTHPQAKDGWMAAGYIVWEVDFEREIVRFRKTRPNIMREVMLTERYVMDRLHALLEERYGRLLRDVEVDGKTFDFVSADGTVIGEAIIIRSVKSPSSYVPLIAGHVWFLEKVKAARKFIVFCGDPETPRAWIARFGKLIRDITCYFFDGKNLIEILGS